MKRVLVILLWLLVAALPLGTTSAQEVPPPTPTPAATAEQVSAPSTQEVIKTRDGRSVTVRRPATVRTADGREAVANRVIVGFKDGLSPADRADTHSRAAQRGLARAAVVSSVG